MKYVAVPSFDLILMMGYAKPYKASEISTLKMILIHRERNYEQSANSDVIF